jgi:hypothetical protein
MITLILRLNKKMITVVACDGHICTWAYSTKKETKKVYADVVAHAMLKYTCTCIAE